MTPKVDFPTTAGVLAPQNNESGQWCRDSSWQPGWKEAARSLNPLPRGPGGGPVLRLMGSSEPSALTLVLNYLNFHKVCYSHQGAGLSKCTFLSAQLSSLTSRAERLNVRLCEKSKVKNYLCAVITTTLVFFFLKKTKTDTLKTHKARKKQKPKRMLKEFSFSPSCIIWLS